MPKRFPPFSMDIKERQRLIHEIPYFSQLNPLECEELAALWIEESYFPGERIVKEGELIDSIYIIVQGHAEVSQRIGKRHNIPIALLNPGETIGLNDTGLFSTTGKRSATVTAISEASVLNLKLTQLYLFLQKYPHLQNELYANTEQISRMILIKNSLPFTYLSHDRLFELAALVKEIKIPAGEIIFHEGEIGKCAYLIYSGEIEIFCKDDSEIPHRLATLEPPALFGEATLMTQTTRNATARAVTDSILFALNYEYLSELMESEKNVANMFMTLMIDRSRPQKNPHVLAYPRLSEDRQEMVILKNPQNGRYFKLSKEGWYAWQEMDGKHTMQEIIMLLAKKYDFFTPNLVAALIAKLARADFVKNVPIDQQKQFIHHPVWLRAILKIRDILESKITLRDVDPWITKLYHHVGFLFFTPISKILLSIFILLSFFIFITMSSEIIIFFKTVPHSWTLIFLFFPLMLLSAVVHELGHALATKSYGLEVHCMGIGWYWFKPVAFTDTSDMWLAPRKPRIIVNFAGIYADLFVAAFSILVMVLVPWNSVKVFLWLYCLYIYVSAFRKLNPLEPSDGYYVLVDLFDQSNLRQTAVTWLVNNFFSFSPLKKLVLNKPAIIYWLACIIFLILISIVTLFIQHLVFAIFEFHPESIGVRLMLPLLATFIASIGIIIDVLSEEQ